MRFTGKLKLISKETTLIENFDLVVYIVGTVDVAVYVVNDRFFRSCVAGKNASA